MGRCDDLEFQLYQLRVFQRVFYSSEVEYYLMNGVALRPGQRGVDSLSMKSSDSDVSDVSAMSSASRLSSASYMSVQSERARAARKIRWGVRYDL